MTADRELQPCQYPSHRVSDVGRLATPMGGRARVVCTACHPLPESHIKGVDTAWLEKIILGLLEA